MTVDHLPAVESQPFILIPRTVEDLDDFVARPEQHLVSMYAEPRRAARLWQERLKHHPYGSEGLLRLTYFGHDLIGPELGDEVSGIWFALVDCVEAYLENNEGRTSFAGQPVVVELRRTAAGAVFGVDGSRILVDPAEFIPGLLDEASRCSRWVEEHIGTLDAPPLRQIEALRRAVRDGDA